jgi:hypothetical protein
MVNIINDIKITDNSKEKLLNILDDIISDNKINNHHKKSTEAESGLDEFESIVFKILTKELCVYDDLSSILMFLSNDNESGCSVTYSTHGGYVAINPLLLNLLKSKIEELRIHHDDIKSLEKAFFLYVGMESDDYSDKLYRDSQDEYLFNFDLYSSGFENNPIRDIASKALHILAFLSQRLYNGEQSVSVTEKNSYHNFDCIVRGLGSDQLKKNNLAKAKSFVSLEGF